MTSLFHLALNVHDVERSIAFYRAVFGLEPDKVRAGFARFTLPEPGLVLSLNRRAHEPGRGPLAHAGVRLPDASALGVVRERVRRAGLPTREQERIHCCHAIETKLWVTDPDGVEWEFYELVDDLQEPAPSQAAPPAASKGRCCS